MRDAAAGRRNGRDRARQPAPRACRAARSPPGRLAPARCAAPLALALALVGCGSSGSGIDGPVTVRSAHVAAMLDAYRGRGFLVGTAEFPVVGRLLLFPGPADSAWLGFAASMPPSALRFSREGDLFSARYQVRLTAVAGGDTVLRRVRREVVRVDDFPATASGEERVFFQRFVPIGPGEHEVEVEVRELTSRRETSHRFLVTWPVPGTALTEPQPVFRATPRESLAQEPPMLVAPRATLSAGREPLLLVVEDAAGEEGPLLVEVVAGSDSTAPLWTETVQLERRGDGPATAIGPLPQRRVPPGVVRVRVRRPDAGSFRETALLVVLDDEWATLDFASAAGYLAYAASEDSIAAWRAAAPAERVRLWEAFWDESDPDPSTSRNEFLAAYFDRMSAANVRYSEPGIAGWRTDRGRAHVQLGPPDREVPHRPQRAGERMELEWIYDESLPIRVRLVFQDTGDFGVYTLDQRSRIVLREAVTELAGIRRRDREEAAREAPASSSAAESPPGGGDGP
jgi:GWxTD domain-containing protein